MINSVNTNIYFIWIQRFSHIHTRRKKKSYFLSNNTIATFHKFKFPSKTFDNQAKPFTVSQYCSLHAKLSTCTLYIAYKLQLAKWQIKEMRDQKK